MQDNQLRGKPHYRCVLKQDYPGANHPRSLSVREDHLLPAIDNWLNDLFNDTNIDTTCQTLAASQKTPTATIEEQQARQTIKDCDTELANYRAALKTAPSDTVAQWISETEARRKTAEIRLRHLTTGQGLTTDEIHAIVTQMNNIITILRTADPQDRQRVYQATQLTITYDHANRRAKLHASPNPEAWSTVRVGGGT